MSQQRRVLVAGVTGYVGGRLVPELLADGHEVCGLARTPGKLAGRGFADHERFTAVRGDVFDRDSLDAALAGIEVAYYLVHSMGGGEGFEDRDQVAARTFAEACEAAGVARIIYLGGLGREDDPELSPHLRSRHETGRALASTSVPVTELRAAIIVGSGSASFEIIEDLARKLPVMITPRWVQSLCEPIAIRDVVWYLVNVLDEPRTVGEVLEIGSGEQLPYLDLMRICAQELGRTIHNLTVPVLTPRLSSYWLHLVTSVDRSVAQPLVEGLRNDVVVHDTRIREWLPRDLSSYRLAVQRALAKGRQPDVRESRWTDAERRPRPPMATPGRIGGGAREPHRLRLWPSREAFRDYRTVDTELPPEELFARVTRIGGRNGYGRRVDWLWRLRGIMDRIVGGTGLRRGRPPGDLLAEGDALDFWRVERLVAGRQLRLVAEMLVPGVARLDFRVEALPDGGSRLHQLATLSNVTVWSGLYWGAIAPLHDWVFPQLADHVIHGTSTAPTVADETVERRLTAG